MLTIAPLDPHAPPSLARMSVYLGQAAPRHPHNDVVEQQRARALREGACPVDRRQLLIAAKALRRRPAEPQPCLL
jgi:hypothetical protein